LSLLVPPNADQSVDMHTPEYVGHGPATTASIAGPVGFRYPSRVRLNPNL
jgi:hypothetical protein